ncbi:MAG: helix-turn-helix transcriptional regulator [Candidatus Rokubacteria bacterium]|nr:helix-turn-helix transcriptional regulator [Candidatus Rokubacteria bacterium]
MSARRARPTGRLSERPARGRGAAVGRWRTGVLAGAAPVFAALGDETRLGLVARLCTGRPTSIVKLTAGRHVTRQAVTKHLHVLAGTKLVRGARIGRDSVWEVEPARLDEARRWLDHIAGQ